MNYDTGNPRRPNLDHEQHFEGGATSETINLGAGGYTYLVGDWDGPTGGEAVYDISGLTGDITVNDTGDSVFNNANAGLSNIWLVDGPAGSVPDNFTTAVLLGIGLLSICLVRRKKLSAV